MDQELELKKNEAGEVVQVVTTTEVNEIPISSVELQRQIDEHQAIVNKLQEQYNIVKDFEDSVTEAPAEDNDFVS